MQPFATSHHRRTTTSPTFTSRHLANGRTLCIFTINIKHVIHALPTEAHTDLQSRWTSAFSQRILRWYRTHYSTTVCSISRIVYLFDFLYLVLHQFLRVFSDRVTTIPAPVQPFRSFSHAELDPEPYWTVFSSMLMPYLLLSSFRMGSHRLHFMGARTPFSEMVPSRTCLTATAQGTPTSLAMAE